MECLTTSEGKMVTERFFDLLIRSKKSADVDESEAMALAHEWSSVQQKLSIAIAYAAGLRAGGLSKDQTRAAMLSFLRLFDSETSDAVMAKSDGHGVGNEHYRCA
jgi:hypothetical protein